jgi:hypothetical protein
VVSPIDVRTNIPQRNQEDQPFNNPVNSTHENHHCRRRGRRSHRIRLLHSNRETLAKKIQQQFKLLSKLPKMGDVIEL